MKNAVISLVQPGSQSGSANKNSLREVNLWYKNDILNKFTRWGH